MKQLLLRLVRRGLRGEACAPNRVPPLPRVVPLRRAFRPKRTAPRNRDATAAGANPSAASRSVPLRRRRPSRQRSRDLCRRSRGMRRSTRSAPRVRRAGSRSAPRTPCSTRAGSIGRTSWCRSWSPSRRISPAVLGRRRSSPSSVQPWPRRSRGRRASHHTRSPSHQHARPRVRQRGERGAPLS